VVERLADCLYAPRNVLGAQLVIAVVAKGFDLGRCSQNMMLAAWNDGVTSCPNGIKDAERAGDALGLAGDETVGIVLSFAYPASGRRAESKSAEEWSRSCNRKPLSEVVARV